MSTATAPRIQVFRPTMEEFKNFSEYIAKIETHNAQKAGLAKIIPPENWIPRKKGYDDINLVIPAPISQVVTGRQGLYQQINIQQKRLTVKEFKKMAESNRFKTPVHFDYEDLERKYWKNITYNSPIYGADVSGSIYDDGVEEFNIQHLNTILDLVKDDYEISIEGVNTAYLYFGMWKTTFAWHTEDMDLYSINYLHFGAPKTWYVIPPEHGRRLERLAAGFFNTSYQNCPAFLRHKMTIISPHVLKKFSIPYSKITQEPGEFMITFPFAYHSGFNHGYNCAESTNFALPRWVEYGKRSTSCTCRNDCVKICMDMFVKKFQPDRYDLWLAGKDVGSHPEEPNKQSAAPRPNKCELAISHQREERRREKELQKIKRHPITKVRKTKDKSKAIEKMESDEDTQPYNADEEDQSPRKKLKMDKHDNIYSKDEEIDIETCSDLEESSDNGTEIEKYADCTVSEHIPDVNFEVGSNVDVVTEVMTDACKISNGKVKEVQNNVSLEVQSRLAPTPPKTVSGEMSNDKMSPKKESTLTSQLSPVSNPSLSPAKKQMNTKWPDWISEYPSLQEAIGSGIFSVASIEKSGAETVCIDLSEKTLNTETSLADIKESSSNWRCEKINNLKMKFVQPKKKVVGQKTKLHTNFKKLVSSVSQMKKDHKKHIAQKSATNDAKIAKVKLEKEGSVESKSVLSVDIAKKGLVSPNVTEKDNRNSHAKKEHKKQVSNSNGAKISSEKKDSADKSLSHLPRLTTEDDTERKPNYPTKQKEPSHSTQKKDHATHVSRKSTTKKETTETTPKKRQPASNVCDTKKANTETTPKERQFASNVCNTKKANTDIISKVRQSVATVSPSIIQRGDDSSDNWAQPLKNLWHHQPKKFAAEIEFNQKLASIPPHCAVCVLFTPMFEKSSFPTEAKRLPSISHVRMPAFCFGNKLNKDCISETNTLLRSDGTAPLVVCAKCKVCVHAPCYGLGMLPMGSFLCNRCAQKAEDAECCLCALRGGALKQTTDNQWAHIVCAVIIREVTFESTLYKEPINITKIPDERKTLKCRYCFKGMPELVNRGCCVQCLCGKCCLSYHVTCGYMAGVIFEANDWPSPPNMICTKHSTRRKKPPKRQLTNISVGEQVTAKHKNGIYYKAHVKRKYIQEYYSILFEDNSFSTNTFPEDIISRKITTSGLPQLNEKVEVKWTDNKIYHGTFKGSRTCEQYEVEFENGSILPQERNNIYAADEDLPKEVRAKLGHSSVSRNIDFSSQPEGKRVRVTNQKYVQL